MNNEDALVFWSKCESNPFIKIFSALKARIVESPSRDAERCDKIGERARKKFKSNQKASSHISYSLVASILLTILDVFK